MNPLQKALKDKLAELESLSVISEYEIETQLIILRDQNNEEICHELNYEIMAFAFSENSESFGNAWGTYYGPQTQFFTTDGKIQENPSINQVNKDVIIYWEQRAITTVNPVFQARYAGLVWDLAKAAVGEKPHYSNAQISCEALLRIANELLQKHEICIIQKLKRALELAISINNEQLIEITKVIIIDYEKTIAVDSKPGLWGFSFDLLVGNKAVVLTVEEEKDILNNLESKLQRLKTADPYVCEFAAERLASYYMKKGKVEDCNRVVTILGDSFLNNSKVESPLVAISRLNHMHHIYKKYNLNTEAEKIARIIREIGSKLSKEMKTITHTVDISDKKIHAFVENLTDGDYNLAFNRIASHFIPLRSDIENQLYALAKKAPMSFLFNRQILDNQGRVVAVVGSLEDDLDGNVVKQMADNMQISCLFLGKCLDHTLNKYNLTAESLIRYLFQSPIYLVNQKELLLYGIKAYMERDYVGSIHLLIPQIELLTRNFVEMAGGVVLKRGRSGGFYLKTLDEVLRSKQMINVLGDDVPLYFRVTLTDQRGWNLRNDICHGILPYSFFSKYIADRLIHVLLVLAQVRSTEDSV